VCGELLRASADKARGGEATAAELNLEDFDSMIRDTYFGFNSNSLDLLRDVRRENVMDEELDELLKASEPTLTMLARIQQWTQPLW
jgi:hypothetical protein